MKSKIVYLALALLCLSTGISAQDLKVCVNEKGKVGYEDSNGNVVIKCEYDGALPFKNGYAIVMKSGDMGIIDKTGKQILPVKYASITPWNDLLLIKDGKNYGLARVNGEIVLKPEFSLITNTNCYGKALIAKGGKATQVDKKTCMRNAKYGIINNQGNVLIPVEYKGLYEFSMDVKGTAPYGEGTAACCVNHFVGDTLKTDCNYLYYTKADFYPISGSQAFVFTGGLLDGNGKILIKEGLYTALTKPQNNMVRTYIIKSSKKGSDITCGYFDLTTGKAFQATSFSVKPNESIAWTHGDFVGDIAPVNSPTQWSFIDKTGKALRSGYKGIGHSPYYHIWYVQNASGIREVFDENNNDIPALSGYEDIGVPAQKGDKEVYNVKKDGKWGVITRSGEVIVPFGQYETIWFNNYDFMMVFKDKKFGAITPDGKEIIPVKYEGIALPEERNAKEFWIKEADSLYYHYNIDKGTLSSKGYKYFKNFKDGIAWVVPYGFTPQDNLINKCLFFVPNSDLATINKLKPSEKIGYYGILINQNDEVLFSEATTNGIYMDKIVKYIQEKGNRPLTKSEMKNLLLEITKENRSYGIADKIGEEEWNY